MFNIQPIKSPWAVQVLTLDYVVEGLIDSVALGYIFRSDIDKASGLEVHSAHIQLLEPARLTAPEVVPVMGIASEAQVAVIPRDADSLAQAQKDMKVHKQAVAGAVHVGPYLIQGQMLFRFAEWKLHAAQAYFPVRDAVITSAVRGLALGELRAPFALVYTRHARAMWPL